MKAVTGELPTGDGWAAEVKFDGMRIMAAVGDPAHPLRLDTTRGHDAAARFPELAGLPAALVPHQVVLDGEVVAFDDTGRPNFGLLQRRMHLTRSAEIAQVAAQVPVRYIVFDILWLDGHDLTGLTYLERRKLLADLVAPGEGWLVPAHHVDGAAELLEAARAQRLEGIVVKRVDSRYVPGSRSPAWRKVKVRPRQEFVIGGWQDGAGGRSGQLGSILVGFYDGDRLRFAGKVGTGFKDMELTRLGGLLAQLAADACPFDPAPPSPVSRVAHWVRPELVAEVTFGEWTDDGILRHASYIATREDKDPRDVVRES
ncbi:MAG: non-homologous end-joining DNA ligase [Acidimicrobiales bacterium]